MMRNRNGLLTRNVYQKHLLVPLQSKQLRYLMQSIKMISDEWLKCISETLANYVLEISARRKPHS